MKIIKYYGKGERTVQAAVDSHLTDTDSYGLVERVDDIARKTATNFGLLVERLADKGLLTAEEVQEFVGYGFEVKP